MAVTDYHVHTARCGHAGGATRDYVLHAVSRGLTEVAITDHVPLYFLEGDDPEPGLAMTRAELPGYVEEVLALREEFRGTIDVLLGIEADYAEGHEEALRALLAPHDWDVVLGSVHLVAGGWIDAPGAGAARALAAARGIDRRIALLAAGLARECGVEPLVHVGVHSGVVVQGDIAFRGRRSRAGVGRAVDAARFLPEAARSAGRRFAISAPALDEAGALAPAAGPAQVLALGGADLAVWIADAVPDDGRVELVEGVLLDERRHLRAGDAPARLHAGEPGEGALYLEAGVQGKDDGGGHHHIVHRINTVEHSYPPFRYWLAAPPLGGALLMILEKLRGRSAEDIHSRAVDILVSRLRRKLEPLDCIHTLRNAGYTFAGVRA